MKYIKSISNVNSDIQNMDNVLFHLLEQSNPDNIQKSIDVLTSFFMDIITNMIQEYIDPNWIISISKSLSEKIGIQKEREKQSLLQKLDMMNQEDRQLFVQKQNYGLSNWYQAAAQDNQDYINSDEYKQATDQERNEYINEINQQSIVQRDVLNNVGLNHVDINFNRPSPPKNSPYDEYDFTDGDGDFEGMDRNTIDDY